MESIIFAMGVIFLAQAVALRGMATKRKLAEKENNHCHRTIARQIRPFFDEIKTGVQLSRQHFGAPRTGRFNWEGEKRQTLVA